MDRGSKSTQGRGSKAKTPQYPADLFALGSKSSSEAKRPGSVHSKPSTSHGLAGGDRKREPGSSALPASLVPPKKQKTGTGAPSILGRAGGTGGAEAWEMVALECDPVDFVPSVLEASKLDEGDRVVGLLCGAVRALRNQRWKPEPLLYIGLCYIGKVKPSLLASDCVVHALASLLRRDTSTSHGFKTKGSPVVPVLAANLLMRAFHDKHHWPELFIKLYVEDSIGDRVWVDHEDSAGFVNNIVTALSTRMPPRSFLQPEHLSSTSIGVGGARSEACPSPSIAPPSSLDDDSMDLPGLGSEGSSTGSGGGEGKEKMDITVIPRYAGNSESVEQVVMDIIREQLNRRQPAENITRNFLRLMASCCGLVEVRLAAVPRLEIWLQNPKLMRPAQELLMAVCMNCNTHTQRDIEVVSQLVKIRLKTKALINLYLSCIRELVSAHPDNLATVLKHTIYNELSQARNPNNMSMVGVMFQVKPDEAASLLADIFMELLLNREDYLRPLRALLREVVRVLRHDINMTVFCRGLLQDRKEPRDFDFKERMFVSLGDLITLCIFLSISPTVREASSLLARGDKRELAVLQNFQMNVAQIQRDAVWWLHNVALKVYRPAQPEFVHVLHKIMFVEHPEQYYNKDNWPPENERALFLRLASEVPLLQQSLLCVLLIGLSKEHPVNAPDVLELADQLVKRAASLPMEGFSMLQTDKLEIIDLVFNLTAYHHPDNINLPAGYCPPQLAINHLYWKAWVMLLIMATHNPTTFGSVAWEKYPTLRTFMEMCITNQFQYPPPTMSMGEVAEETRSKELQMAALEKQQILEFETYLAAASTRQTITEQTSLLLPQLITLDPTGPPRQPPAAVLEQLKLLNTTHRMGHLLCRSRRPDFLLDIIQRQGPSQSMPWLADLVDSSEGSFSHLPVQCLCEFLLSAAGGSSGAGAGATTSEKQHKQQRLLRHLQAVLMDPEQDPTGPCEILEYFLRRLGSSQTAARAQAIKGLREVLSSVTVDEEAMDVEQVDSPLELTCNWLVRSLPQLPHFPAVRPQAVQALRQACQVENEPALVSSYICFLASHTAHDSLPELGDLVLDMAQLIVERSSIVAAILPSTDCEVPGAATTQHALMLMFHSFFLKARMQRNDSYPWSDSQDQILVTWSTGEQATMHVLIVHAIIILLNYGPAQEPDELFESLLEMWFPYGQPLPKAYLVMTSEEALLIPDWLKLRMIRSNVDRLVDAALTDLEPGQLVLFIQSFGIPVRSMSKLLRTLDRAVATDPVPVAEAVLDKSYMAQLVEVQHHRGAQGGHMLVEVLRLEQPLLPDYQSQRITVQRQTLPPLSDLQQERARQVTVTQAEVPGALLQLFDRATTPAVQRALFRMIQRSLALEVQHGGVYSLMHATVHWLNVHGLLYAGALVNAKHFSSPLLRLLAASAVGPSESATKLRRQLRPVLHKLASSPELSGIVRPFLCQLRPSDVSAEKKSEEFHAQQQPIGKDEVIEVLQTTPSSQLERVGSQLLDRGVHQHCAKQLVEGIASLLLEDTTEETKPSNAVVVAENRGVPSAHMGLLIDWLAAVEPELIRLSPDVQMKLLFARPVKDIGPGNTIQTCRPYLLSLLTHRAGWGTLQQCVNCLLERCDSEHYYPPAVLDFLWALTCNPRLWQGRDRFTPKHYHPEDVLCLTLHQLLVLVEYVVAEAQGARGRGLLTEAVVEGMESRLPLLQQCLENGDHAAVVSKHLLALAAADASSGERVEVAALLLLLLYLRHPALLHHLTEPERDALLARAGYTANSSSLLDTMSHALLTALTAGSQSGKDWNRRSQEYELLARKMASVHPVLVLRQLPLLAASLQGRVHLELQVFRSRHHLTLFSQVLGLLELLRPWLFAAEHAHGLHATLSCYLALARQHGHAKDVAMLLQRLVALLQAFLAADAPRAIRFLQQHALMLSDLQHMHPSLSGLRSLLASISLPKTDSEDGSSDALLATVAAAPPTAPSPQYASLLNVLSRHQGDDVFVALQDLEHMSARKPSVLESFTETLADLMTSPTGNIRTLSHTLLLRYIRHDPAGTGASVALSAFVRCLDSEQPDVLASALDRLPEVVMCAQEHALPLLQKVFRLGMCCSANTLPSITKTIALLNVQAGC